MARVVADLGSFVGLVLLRRYDRGDDRDRGRRFHSAPLDAWLFFG